MWYIAIKKIRQDKKNKENAIRGQYKIVQATCISSTKEVREDEDGTTVFYIAKFSNGESQTLNYSLGVEGDTLFKICPLFQVKPEIMDAIKSMELDLGKLLIRESLIQVQQGKPNQKESKRLLFVLGY